MMNDIIPNSILEKTHKEPVTILMADDDHEDRELVIEALRSAKLANDFHAVEDGRELIDYLQKSSNPRPHLILLDLNMPRMSGLEALKEIKKDAHLKRIPIIMLTTSASDRDIVESYELGVNSYITKPVDFSGLTKALKAISDYWFEIVTLSPY